MTYDRADWHYGGEFPSELPPDKGGTHIGMFLAWAAKSGLIGSFHLQNSSSYLEQLSRREITGCEFLVHACDEKFWPEDLSEEGNSFAREYYESDYFEDYFDTLASDLPTVYHVQDTWENFDRLCPVLENRFNEWKNKSK